MAKLTDTHIFGDLVVTGTTRFKNDVVLDTEIKSDFIPDSDGSYSLGSAILRFSNIYSLGLNVSGQITSIDTDTNNIFTIGNSANNSAVQIAANSNQYELYVNGSIAYTIQSNGDHYIEDSAIRLRTSGLDTAGIMLYNSGNGQLILTRDADNWNDSVRVAEDLLRFYSQGNSFTWDGTDIKIGNNRILTVADEGAGNGLDADTLDGQHGSAYSRVSLSNTFTQSQYIETTANHLYFRETDGAVDAKLWTFTANNAEFSIQSRQDNGTFLSNLLTIDRSGNLTTLSDTYTVWTSGNDGSGSGLDADLLDGINSAQFLRSDTDDTFNGVLTITGNLSVGDGSFGVGNLSGQGIVVSNNDGGSTGRILIDVEDITSGYNTRISQSNDGFIFESESNSRPLLFYTGSTLSEIMRVDIAGVDVIGELTTTGDASFGTASANARLHVAVDSSYPAAEFERTGSNPGEALITFAGNNAYFDLKGNATYGVRFTATTSSDLQIETGSTNRLTILDTGEIGFGTDSPLNNLHIASSNPTIRFEDTDGASAYAQIQIDANGSIVLKADPGATGASSSLIDFEVDGSRKVRIGPSGFSLATGGYVSSILDEDTMSSNSSTALATQQSIKAYVDAQISGGTGDAGTLDGLDSTQFLRSDQNDTMSGNLTVTGSVTVGSGVIGAWDSGDTDITGIIPGTSSGTIIEGPVNAHVAIGIRGNNDSDGFYVINTGNSGNASYTQALLTVNTSAFEYFGDAIWHEGNFDPTDYATLTGASFTGDVSTTGNISADTDITVGDDLILNTNNTSSIFVRTNGGTLESAFRMRTTDVLDVGTNVGIIRLHGTNIQFYDGISSYDIWHENNFDPTDYAELAGATFTGAVEVENVFDVYCQGTSTESTIARFYSDQSRPLQILQPDPTDHNTPFVIQTSNAITFRADSTDGLSMDSAGRIDVHTVFTAESTASFEDTVSFAENVSIINQTGSIAGTTWDNGWLKIGSSGAGWAFDSNELYNAGTAIIGTMTGDLTFNVAGTMNVGATNFQYGGNAVATETWASSEFVELSGDTMTGRLTVATTADATAASFTNTSSSTLVYSRGGNGYGAFYAQGSGTNAGYLFLGNVTNGERSRISAGTNGHLFMRSFGDTMVFQVDNGSTEPGKFTSTGLEVVGNIEASGVIRYSTSGTQIDSGGLTLASGSIIEHDNTSSRDKIRVWSSPNYTIGMQDAFTYGYLGTDYAMTFQMNNVDGRGFWWGDTGHDQSQGAMSLTTDGRLFVDQLISVGGTIDATGQISSDGTFCVTTVGSALKRVQSGWTYDDHDLVYSGFASGVGDYSYLKAAGNSAGSHGMAIMADNGFYVGQANITTGGITADLTNPMTSGTTWLRASSSVFEWMGNEIWHADNDGSGSGLDADTLDGIQGSSYVRTDTGSIRTSGTLRNNDGVRLALGTGNDAELWFDGSNLYLDIDAGNLYIRNVTTTAFTFGRTSGDFTASGNITAYSDERLKNFTGILDRPSLIDELNVYTFNWKKNDKASIGVNAQELQKIVPEFVTECEKTGNLSVDYGKYAVATLFEEKKRRETLEERVRKLEKIIKELLDK